MPIFEYKCKTCSSVFEHLFSNDLKEDIYCLACGGLEVERTDSTIFYPNKFFCPHEGKSHGRGRIYPHS